LHAPSAWVDAHHLGLTSLGVGLPTLACARPRLLPFDARAGRGPNMKTPGAGFATP